MNTPGLPQTSELVKLRSDDPDIFPPLHINMPATQHPRAFEPLVVARILGKQQKRPDREPNTIISFVSNQNQDTPIQNKSARSRTTPDKVPQTGRQFTVKHLVGLTYRQSNGWVLMRFPRPPTPSSSSEIGLPLFRARTGLSS